MIPRLGVNIDHFATVRQVRGETYPSTIDAAAVSFDAGADQITIHLREDRRHIQDTDVEAIRLVTKKFGRPLNLEMGCSKSIIEVATTVVPDWVCLVPENRQEKTTEGGLDLLNVETFERVKSCCQRLREVKKNIKVSLFLEAHSEILEKALLLAPEAVEIHTGEYARTFLNGDSYQDYLEQFKEAKAFLQKHQIAYHAGHGLTAESVVPLLKEHLFIEYNIGHWIVSQAMFDGLKNVVRRLKDLFEAHAGEI